MDSRLGVCEICNSLPAKYTCPGCEINSCSVACVKEHKNSYGCDGLRSKTAYKPLSKMNDMDLKSDYGLLEEIASSADAYSRDPAKRKGNRPGDIPKLLHYLREAAHKRDMKLWFMPSHFTRRKINRSYHNFKIRQIEWTVQFIFHISKGENKVAIANKIAESTMLKDCAQNILGQEKGDWVDGFGAKLDFCDMLLQAENIKDAKSRFFKMDPEKTLQENLRGHTLVEFPIFTAVPQEFTKSFKLVTLEEANKEIIGMIEDQKKQAEKITDEMDVLPAADGLVEERAESERKRARLDIPEYKDICRIEEESDEEMDIGGNFFNL
ncbi:box C/D snoRNA protein 1 [Neocloeon triangulifer]|uniref:box C/D snoRNA protein 1 n=1 Tax=Neocloeon triangulifer TaxID=2078957 RepID=UPI00286F0EF5|nr:box C/D snoRNA protein 1 [Neocloeon triangulifer]